MALDPNGRVEVRWGRSRTFCVHFVHDIERRQERYGPDLCGLLHDGRLLAPLCKQEVTGSIPVGSIYSMYLAFSRS